MALFKKTLIKFASNKALLVSRGIKRVINGPCYKLGDGYSVLQYILDNSCFPLLPWLITPYLRPNEERDSLNLPKKEFNAVHSQAMGLIEMAFGRVRASWQFLSKRWKERCVEYLPFVIVTGFVA